MTDDDAGRVAAFGHRARMGPRQVGADPQSTAQRRSVVLLCNLISINFNQFNSIRFRAPGRIRIYSGRLASRRRKGHSDMRGA